MKPTPAWTWTRCARCPRASACSAKKTHGSLLIITHSTRILEALRVDRTHVMENGVIVREGDAALVEEINEKGFKG